MMYTHFTYLKMAMHPSFLFVIKLISKHLPKIL